MKSHLMHVLAALLAIACAGAARAQGLDPARIVDAGFRVGQMIDEARLGDLWDGASPVTRQRLSRQAFADGVSRARADLGAPRARHWVSVARSVTAGGGELASGRYVSVQYETTFSSGRVAHELVSFRLDEDQTWRVVGYAVR